MSHFFYSLITFITALFFVLLGIVGIILPWSPNVRTEVMQFIVNQTFFSFLFGLGFLIVGLAIMVNIILSMRKRYYEIRSGKNMTAIDESLFQDYLTIYWKQLFPQHDVPNQVTLNKNKIHVTADLPFLPVPQQKILIERIERDIADIFNRMLGYRFEYIISISFLPESKKNP